MLNTQSHAERGSSNLYVNTKVRDFVECSHCGKVRCLYSDTKLIEEEIISYKMAIQTWPYACGCPLVPTSHSLYNRLYVREKIGCSTPLEVAYYSCRKSKIFRCYWCGSKDDLLDITAEFREQYQVVYPMCVTCQIGQKDFFTRGHNNTNQRSNKKRKFGNK